MALLADTTGTASVGMQSVLLASSYGVAAGQVVQGAGIPAETFVLFVIGSVVTLSQPITATLVATPLQFFQPVTLTREDSQAFQYFEPDYLQTQGFPKSWTSASEPPLSFDVDLAPSVPGYYDVIALVSSSAFAPPAAALLGVPDDWSMLPLYGALADVLGKEAESTDEQRAAYCMTRYTQGMEILKQSNWLVRGTVDGVAVDTPALSEMDDYAPEWEASAGNLPAIVQGGMDFLAATPGVNQSLSLTLIGNAPLLDATGVYVQVARDDFEAILNYAQCLACFKQGSSEFTNTIPMLQDFYRAVAARNKRWSAAGLFTDVLKSEGKRQEEVEPR